MSEAPLRHLDRGHGADPRRDSGLRAPVRYEVQGPPTRPRHQWGAAIAVHPNFFESHLVLLGIGECLGEESVPPVDMPDTHAAPASCFE
ncbi:MAG: hypothetical protein IPG17_13905 [Sandaracinaceae bacterium]|nr:hypothetical protein [Sandaracinaceae bacterium]